ncbi:MAG: spore cortex biosynthesis protein YabQ, partial [Clostridia bacterium]|nr:spore cortex biosynthesis protein YabQ [Clostridia bacterium]
MNTAQSILFLIFIVNGILIGLLFDIFRILRRTFKTGDIITYIEDILFWLLTGASILYNIFIYNNGEIRLFMFIAIGIRSNNIFFNNK